MERETQNSLEAGVKTPDAIVARGVDSSMERIMREVEGERGAVRKTVGEQGSDSAIPAAVKEMKPEQVTALLQELKAEPSKVQKPEMLALVLGVVLRSLGRDEQLCGSRLSMSAEQRKESLALLRSAKKANVTLPGTDATRFAEATRQLELEEKSEGGDNSGTGIVRREHVGSEGVAEDSDGDGEGDEPSVDVGGDEALQ